MIVMSEHDLMATRRVIVRDLIGAGRSPGLPRRIPEATGASLDR